MRIRFGLHRDGLDPTPPRTALGELTLGPQGLIRVLESDLGLAPVLYASILRIPSPPSS